MKCSIFKMILICLGVIIHSASYSQNNSSADIGVHITPMLILPVTNNNSNLEFERGVGYEIGGDFYLDISRKLQLKFGVNYSFLNVKINDYGLVFNCDLDSIPGAAGGNNLHNSWISETNRIHALGLGVESRLKLVGEENHLYLKLGFNGKFNINSSQVTELVECGLKPRETMDNPRTELKKLYWELKTGIGYERAISTKVKVFLEPEIRYALNDPIDIIDLISENNKRPKFLNLGLNIGLRF